MILYRAAGSYHDVQGKADEREQHIYKRKID